MPALGDGGSARKRHRLHQEMLERGSISVQEGSDLLGETKETVRAPLKDLLRSEVARASGNTRARRYLPR